MAYDKAARLAALTLGIAAGAAQAEPGLFRSTVVTQTPLGGGTHEKRLYAHPCGNGDPIVRGCPNESLDVTDPTYEDCNELGLREGDLCPPGLERCVLKPAQACVENPTQIVSSAYYLWCRDQPFDPDMPCPISTRAAKQDIDYLDEAERERLADEVLGLKLATYEYKEGMGGMPGKQLGFILEDNPEAAFVLSEARRVNMYSYVSALVATVQSQQKRLDAMEQELAALKSQGPKTKKRTTH